MNASAGNQILSPNDDSITTSDYPTTLTPGTTYSSSTGASTSSTAVGNGALQPAFSFDEFEQMSQKRSAKIRNTDSVPIAVKTFSLNNEHLSVSPAYGLIQPGGELDIVITFRPYNKRTQRWRSYDCLEDNAGENNITLQLIRGAQDAKEAFSAGTADCTINIPVHMNGRTLLSESSTWICNPPLAPQYSADVATARPIPIEIAFSDLFNQSADTTNQGPSSALPSVSAGETTHAYATHSQLGAQSEGTTSTACSEGTHTMRSHFDDELSLSKAVNESTNNFTELSEKAIKNLAIEVVASETEEQTLTMTETSMAASEHHVNLSANVTQLTAPAQLYTARDGRDGKERPQVLLSQRRGTTSQRIRRQAESKYPLSSALQKSRNGPRVFKTYNQRRHQAQYMRAQRQKIQQRLINEGKLVPVSTWARLRAFCGNNLRAIFNPNKQIEHEFVRLQQLDPLVDKN